MNVVLSGISTAVQAPFSFPKYETPIESSTTASSGDRMEPATSAVPERHFAWSPTIVPG